ncbi:MAG TPA: NlpC/P60 family protein [Limnobacter sp.]|nr:NlpC/P60 family protein [Limnobacter sp.]
MSKNSLSRSLKTRILALVLIGLPVHCIATNQEQQPWEASVQESSYSAEVRDALLAHYSSWAGTRHKLGGTGENGVDCSSFIQTLFQDRFKTVLPRSSREQMTLGERVDLSELQSGDLLFFRTGPTRRHVGVYLGDNQFMHVSTRAGVEIAKLFSPYWQRHFITARRLGLGGF